MSQGEMGQNPDTPGLEELLDYGLVVHNIFNDVYLLADPFQVWRHHVSRERQGIAEAVAHLETLEALFATITTRSEAGGAGISYLSSKDEANGEIIMALAKARDRVCTAHPLPRQKRTMELSLPRDIELLERGLSLHTIYTAEARSRKAEGDWARQVIQYGAEVRTLKGRFHRMVLIDDAFVLVSDHTKTANVNTAWKVDHPGLVAFLSEVFADQWRRAEPWLGGQEDGPSAETLTTPMTRTILRGLSIGRTQGAIANELGVSTRTLTNHLTKLYDRLGFEPGDQFRLGGWWAASHERELD
jgi:DNA-binding CsgD family transcriptional regulator